MTLSLKEKTCLLGELRPPGLVVILWSSWDLQILWRYGCGCWTI